MKPVSREDAIRLIKEANTCSMEQIALLQQERLQELVDHARTHSALYREKYAHLPETPRLKDLPVITKPEITGRMQDLICDPDFTTEALEAYLSDLNNLGRLFMGKYSVATTSGTTGVPLIMLRDQRHITINGAILQVRLYESPLFKDFPDIFDPRIRFASVLATGGFHTAFMAFENRRKALEQEGISGTMELLRIGEAVPEMVRRLNAFQPEVITGYPSVMHVLAGEQQEKRLQISPKIILCSAEQLTEAVRLLLEKTFNCRVGNVFCSTEGGEAAILCDHGHMHLNPDWVVMEPVDRNGSPVQSGTMSDAVLVTNLTNAVQPIIRYRVDDSVILHDTPCPCGLPFPYVDILGRSDDLPEFSSAGGIVRLSPIAFMNVVLEIPGMASYQFVQTGPESLVLRLAYQESADPDAVDHAMNQAMRIHLQENGLENVLFEIVRAEPVRAQKGKKMRTYLKNF